MGGGHLVPGRHCATWELGVDVGDVRQGGGGPPAFQSEVLCEEEGPGGCAVMEKRHF